MKESILVPCLSLGVGLVGVIVAAVDVLGQTYEWQVSISAILLLLVFLLLGGPLILISFLTSSMTEATSLDISMLISYLLGLVAAVFLAGRLELNKKRWWVLSFLSPYVPAIILSVRALTTDKQLYGPQPVSQPARVPTSVAAPVDTSIKTTRILELVRSILDADSFGHPQIRSRDELRAHQNEPSVEMVIKKIMQQETDIYRRIKVVELLGDLKAHWSYMLLVDMSTNDPYTSMADEFYPSSDPDVEEQRSHVTVYPVREAAEKALKKHRSAS